jgi:hypothetical protein
MSCPAEKEVINASVAIPAHLFKLEQHSVHFVTHLARCVQDVNLKRAIGQAFSAAREVGKLEAIGSGQTDAP